MAFSYINIARQFSVIELCREQKNGSGEINLKFFAMDFLLFSIMHIFAFISPESSRFFVSIK